MDFAEWARLRGIRPEAACRWFREGALPVPAVQVNSRSVLVAPDAVIVPARGGIGLYARVSSHDQGAGLGQRVARLTARAARCGRAVVRAGAEAGSGMNGARSKARWLLAGPGVHTEADGDLVRVMVEVLAWFCARLYGRRPARSRALKAAGCTPRDTGPRAVAGAGRQDAGHG
jgi:putative resolvase